MTPARLVRPTVGLIPTTPLALAGETIEPFVSVPMATAQRLAAGATPDPELEPPGERREEAKHAAYSHLAPRRS